MSIQRPANVPADAEFLQTQSWGKVLEYWQLGTKDGGRCVGEWTYWRRDGSVLERETYDKNGNLDGERERYHPDGSVAVHQSFKAGKPHGVCWGERSNAPSDTNWRLVMSSVLIDQDDNPVWRNEITYSHGKQVGEYRFFLHDGRACNGRGVPKGEKLPRLRAIVEAFDKQARELPLVEQVELANLRAAEIVAAAASVRWLISHPIAKLGPPATVKEIVELERDFGPLPGSYRTFLEIHGQLRFDSRRDTAPPGKIIELSKVAQQLIDGRSEYDDEDDEEDVTAKAVDSWTALKVNGLGGWLPEHECAGRFLRVTADETDGVVLGLDLPARDGERPFFAVEHDDPYFYLVGRTTKEWLLNLLGGRLGDLVDEVERAHRD